MLNRQPLRTLNTETTVLGLNISDIIFVLAIYSVFNSVLMIWKLEVLSIPISTLAAVVLVPIRLNNRRRIIRDFLILIAIRFLKNGVARVPARFRYYRI